MNTKFFTNLFLALCLVLGALAVAPVSPARAATLTVDTLMDENDGSCMDGDCSLRDAIQVAAPGDTITFSVNGTILMNSEINTVKNLNISGPGADLLTLSGSYTHRVFKFWGTVSMSDLTIANGYILDEHGGGIINNGTLTLTNVKLLGNEASSSGAFWSAGGGVANFGSLTMTGGTVSGNWAFKFGGGIFSAANSSISLDGVTISGNQVTASLSSGGGLYMEDGPTSTLAHISVTDNLSTTGGGLFSARSLIVTDGLIANNDSKNAYGGLYLGGSNKAYDLTNVTVSGNASGVNGPNVTSYGGGVGGLGAGSVLNLNHVTISANSQNTTAVIGSGGLYNSAGTVNMRNSVLAGNISLNSADEDCQGPIHSQGYNLIQVTSGCSITGDTTGNLTGVDPLLAPLADNGGSTMTHALQAGSPAINSGDNTNCASTDQRGHVRPQGGTCDMGAYEVDNSAPSDIALSGDSVLENLPAGTMVGSFSTTDLDPADAHVYSFCGGADDASFTLNASDLQTASPFNFEAKDSYSICIRTTDPFGLTYDEVFVISILDVPGMELLAPADGATLHSLRPLFDWSDEIGAKGYQLQVSKKSNFSTTVLNVTMNGAANSQYVPTKDLPANSLLYWRVRTKISATKYGPWSVVYSMTTPLSPSIPNPVSPANNALVTTLTPTLDWSDSTVPAGTTFDHYQVQLDDSADFSSPLLDANSNVSTLVTGPLSMNMKYYWRVRAWNTNGDYSAWSAMRTFREALPAPTLISPILGVTVPGLKPAFDWSDVAGASGYTIQVSLSNTFNSFALNVTLNAPTSVYATTINLQPGKTYFWRVRANGVNGPSLWSAVESFVTP